jgi:DNA-binding GntR family transcriptional regulator
MNQENVYLVALRSRRNQSTTSLVRDFIETMIVDGELKAGTHVGETALAARLGVSRGPVREACRALVESGLLVAEANRGFFVRKLSLQDVIGVYDVRASLARLAGRTLASRTSAEQVRQLASLVERMDGCVECADADAFYRLNLEFHDLINDYSGNAKLAEIHKMLMRDLRLFRRRGLTADENLRASNEEHRLILRSVAAQDVEAAGNAMEAHILKGKERFLSAVGQEVQ